MKTKEIEWSKRDNYAFDYIVISNLNIKSNLIIDLSAEGLYWEGGCLNQSPFGYGSLYNNSNELVYRGVMIGDNKMIWYRILS